MKLRDVLACAAVAMLAFGDVAQAASGTWTSPSSGNWSTTGNWSGGVVADGSGSTADFSTIDITSDVTVTLDSSRTLTSMTFGDTDTVTAAGWTISGANTLTVGTITVNALGTGKEVLISSLVSGTIVKAGAGILTLNGNSTATIGGYQRGTININDGTWTANADLRFAGGTGSATMVLAGSTTMTRGGTLILADGSNAHTGTLTLKGNSELTVTGSLQTNRGTGLTNRGILNVQENAILKITTNLDVGKIAGGTNDRTRGDFTQSGGTTTVGAAVRIANSGDNNHGQGNITISGGTFAADRLEIRPVREKGANTTVTISGGTVTFTNGIIRTNSDRVASNVATSHALNLTGGTVYTEGITSVANSGNTSYTTSFNGGTLKALADNSSFLAGTFTTAPVIGANGFTFDSNGFDIGFSQRMTGSNANAKLTKTGLGTLTLDGDNTYAGGSVVNQGTLVINGTTGAGLITVNDGGTLGGSGTLSGATTVKSGGTHNPGTSPGIQEFAAGLAYESGATLKWELVGNTLGTRGTDFDGVDVTGGDLSIDSGAILSLVFNAAGSTVNWNNAFWAEERTWVMVDFSGAGESLGNFGTVSVSLDSAGNSLGTVRAGASFASTRVGDDVYVSYIIPEPATAGMLLLGMVGMALRRRQKIQQA